MYIPSKTEEPLVVPVAVETVGFVIVGTEEDTVTRIDPLDEL